MHGRLAEPAGVWLGRGILREGRGVPALGVWEVALWGGVRVEDYVGKLAGGPLAAEEGLQLLGGAPIVQVCQAQSDKGAVPAPLVRVELWGGSGPGLKAVAPQDPRRLRVHPRNSPTAGRLPGKALCVLLLTHTGTTPPLIAFRAPS